MATKGGGRAAKQQDTLRCLVRETVDGVPRLLVLNKLKKILDAFGPNQVALTSRQISEITGIPMSTCVRLLRNLAFEGILEKTGDQFRLGVAIARWGSIATTGRTIVELCSPELNEIREKTGETAHLAVRDGFYRICVALSLSNKSVVRYLRVGEVVPIHVGSMGKIFLAFDPEATREVLNRDKLEQFTSKTINNIDILLEDVARIRVLGYAISQEERDYDAIGVTLPIFEANTRMVAGIGISGPIQRVDYEKACSFVQLIRESAQKVSSTLGCINYDAAIEEAGKRTALIVNGKEVNCGY